MKPKDPATPYSLTFLHFVESISFLLGPESPIEPCQGMVDLDRTRINAIIDVAWKQVSGDTSASQQLLEFPFIGVTDFDYVNRNISRYFGWSLMRTLVYPTSP